MNRPTLLIDPASLAAGGRIDPVTNHLTLAELDLPPEQIASAVRAWCHLLGVRADDREAHDDATDIVALAVALLHLKAPDFLRWWQGEDWGAYPRSDDESEAWAWRVSDAVNALTSRAGTCSASVAALVSAFCVH